MQIGRGKQGVEIGEYRFSTMRPDIFTKEFAQAIKPFCTDRNRVLGYIQPACDNPQWILYFTQQGDAILHRKRSETGAVLDKAITIKGQAKLKSS